MTMLSKAVSLASRLSPTFGRLVRELRASITGRRHDDVKRHIDARLREFSRQTNSGAFELSLGVLTDARPNGAAKPDLAFVTNLPPEDTGIASCSFYSWTGHNGAVDVFCPAVDADWFVRNSIVLKSRSPSGSVRLLDSSLLLTASEICKYENIVIALGNSDHNLYVHEILRKISAAGLSDRCVIYMHDACLLNFVEKGPALSSGGFVSYIEDIYGISLDGFGKHLTSWALHAEIARRGIMGLRYIREFGVRRFIVNSRAAQDLVERDLAGTDARIGRVFHPIFLPDGATHDAQRSIMPRAGGPDIVVGTFGVPSGAKRIHEIVAAVRLLHSRSLKIRLVLAGFGVGKFVETYADDLNDLDIVHHDGPADAQLVGYMASVDVAVQLRSQNMGESSGVVSQLLLLSKPVVVSAVGSFAEYGDAVILTRVDASSSDIAAAILEAASCPPKLDAMKAYVEARTPERFRHALLEEVQKIALR